MKRRRKTAVESESDAESSAKFSLDNPFPILVFDPKTMKILEVNEAAVKLYGFDRGEFVGMHMARVRMDAEEQLLWRFHHLPKGKVDWFSSRHQKRDGTILHVKTAVGDISWKGEDARYSIIHDITDQLKIQASLARVLTFAQIGIWELKVATDEVSWTNEADKIFGYGSAAPVALQRFLEVVAPEDKERFGAALQAALASGEPFDIEHRIVRPDGTRRIVHCSAVIERDADSIVVRAMGTVMDVTSWRELEDDLRRRSEALTIAQRVARLGSWDQDLVTGRVEWTQELFEIYGMNPHVDVPRPDEFWKHDYPDDAQNVLSVVRRARDTRTRYDFDHRIIRRGGDIRWVHEQGEYTYDADFKPVRFIGTVLDITERKHAEALIEHQASHDQLTGLPNYSLLLKRLREAIDQAQSDRSDVGVAFLDVDRFKTVNDALGHAAGDAVLEEIARRLESAILPGDTVARAGGDEFILILSSIRGPTNAGDRAKAILEAFENPFQVGEREFFFTATVGISVYPRDSDHALQLIRNADIAMYHGKGLAQNNFQFFSDHMRDVTLRRLALEHGLRGAIDRDELALVFQPIVRATSRAVIGVEALIRWRPKDKDEVGPTDFIPVAEDSGQIVSIGNWIIRKACQQWRAWCDKSRSVRMSVNISGKQLERPDFINIVQSALYDAQMDPDYLDLEITETVLMTQAALPNLEGLRALGIRLVIDDFGTGYSSLAYLKQMPISSLKIDRSFVSYAQTSPADIPISTAIISIAHNLGLEVVAEGVETEAQAVILRDLGCDYLQGYYFARPAAPEVIGEMLKGAR